MDTLREKGHDGVEEDLRVLRKFNNRDIPETKSRKRKITSDTYKKKKSIKLADLKHKWNVLECDQSKNEGYEYDHLPVSTETQRRKTPVSLLNEWAMSRSGSTKNTKTVSYVLIAITGQTHKPTFTYMCQVQDKTAKGQGLSKKEAKQNAAAQMWEQIFKTDPTANSDKIMTFTTIANNFEVNKHNYINNLIGIEESQIIDEANSNISDKKSQYSKYEEVQIAHCAMNPVGALQELSTTYKWVPPRYNFQKLFTNREQQHSKSKRVSYEVTCEVFHLQTMGTAITKKEAKRIAAHKMFDQIYDIGVDKLNELKSSEFNKIMLSKKDCKKNISIVSPKEIAKPPPEWTSAHIFQLYVTAVNNKSVFAPSYPLFESNNNLNLQKEQLEMKENQYQMELEQLILHYNPDLSSIYQLQSLCQQLGFQAIYTQLNNLELQQKSIKNNTNKDEYYAIMLQVSTVPVTVTIGRAMTVDMASEVAAKHILQTYKAMWCYNSPSVSKLNNNQQIPNDDCITFL